MLCKHIIIIYRYYYLEAEEYISDKYFILIYRNIYDQTFAIKLIRITNFIIIEDCIIFLIKSRVKKLRKRRIRLDKRFYDKSKKI